MSIFNRSYLGASWRSWWASDLRRIGPEWMHLVWTVLFSMMIAAAFTIIGFALFASGEGAWRNWRGWLDWYGLNLSVALCVGLTIHALFRLGERWLGAKRIRGFSGLARGLYFAGLPVLGTAIGWPLSGVLMGRSGPGWLRITDPNAIVGSLLLAVLISLVLYQFFGAKERQAAAEKRATEAQLRLLQGQIEPHFLFNTLAGVISLVDHDPPRAKAMLQSFTDYLRASFTTLRRDQGPLAQELDLAEHYLRLLKSRMEDRLEFSISADEAAREVPVPPLLLQPLVENAVHHGLEPNIEGGRVDVRATVRAGLLLLEVQDNGRGLDAAPRRAARPGAGMALANLRERLLALHGPLAHLELLPAQPGTLARVTLPIDPRTS
jgi:hypothetical protein